jgi:hypothetical protein
MLLWMQQFREIQLRPWCVLLDNDAIDILRYRCKKNMATTAGLEPARAKPKRFQVFLLNRSDKLPLTSCLAKSFNIILLVKFLTPCIFFERMP